MNCNNSVRADIFRTKFLFLLILLVLSICHQLSNLEIAIILYFLVMRSRLHGLCLLDVYSTMQYDLAPSCLKVADVCIEVSCHRNWSKGTHISDR